MADEAPDELVVTFRKPVTFAEISYAQMTLREPTAGQVSECGGLDGWAFDLRLLALVSGVPEAALKQLGTRDALKGTRYLGAFLS